MIYNLNLKFKIDLCWFLLLYLLSVFIVSYTLQTKNKSALKYCLIQNLILMFFWMSVVFHYPCFVIMDYVTMRNIYNGKCLCLNQLCVVESSETFIYAILHLSCEIKLISLFHDVLDFSVSLLLCYILSLFYYIFCRLVVYAFLT